MTRARVAALALVLCVMGGWLAWRSTEPTRSEATPIDAPPDEHEVVEGSRVGESAADAGARATRGGDAGVVDHGSASTSPEVTSPVATPIDLELPFEPPPTTPPPTDVRPPHVDTPAEERRAQIEHGADVLDQSTAQLEERHHAAIAAGDTALASELAIRIERQRARAAQLRAEAAQQEAQP